MSVRRLLTSVATTPSVAADAYTLTAGRLVGTVAALVALAGVIVGGLALARAAGRAGAGRRGAIAALVAGSAGMLAGGLVVAGADGGPGSGSGIVGGFVALLLGLTATILGRLTLTRTRSHRPM